LFNQLAFLVEKINLKYTDYIIVVSEVLKHDLIQYGVSAEKILVNPNGTNADLFNADSLYESRHIIRNRLSVKTDTFVFGFVGTFSFWHGIETLAHCIPLITQKNDNCHFILIGEGPLKKFLIDSLAHHKITEKYVTFTGSVEHTKAREYLAACDAFLCPTKPNNDGTQFFGSPTKLFEYMSMAKPVIASQLNQLEEIIFPALSINDLKNNIPITSQTGILVPPHEIDLFAQAGLFLIELDAHSRNKIGINARNRVLQCFTWDHHIQRMHTFIQKAF
jgi:glycosyltransferase involved in cell wall biosynthesis